MKSSFFSISLRDLRISMKDLAAIMQILSLVMLIPLCITIFYMSSYDLQHKLILYGSFIIPSSILYVIYLFLKKYSIEDSTKTKHIMLTFAMTWVIIALVGAIPFLIRGVLGPLDSFFESMSGWTTTGFSMIQDIESTDVDLLFYRSLMQGLGGLGVISLGLMVLLQGGNIGVGYSDVGVQRIKPGIKQTIKEAWKIYGLYILAGWMLLYIAGMTPFDALNHSITAIATGGFSTHADAGYMNSVWVEVILMFLMLLGMSSFIIHYKLFAGDKKAILGSEFRYSFWIIVVAIIAVSISIWGRPLDGVNTSSVFDVLRKSSFHVISGMSTCGYNTVDFGEWPDLAKTLLVGLMYIGGMSSSTAGGIRVIRFVILVGAVSYSLKKLLLPKTAVLVVTIDGKALKDDIMAVVGYSAVYLFVCVALSTVLMMIGHTSVDSILTIMSAMGNDGLGVISGIPWYQMPVIGKITIILAMWVGRVEIYASLLLLRSFLEKINLLH